MIRAGYDAFRGLAGVLRLLTFRPEWAERFDVSASGVARSFFAAAFALPCLFFIIAARERMALELGASPPDMPAVYYVLGYTLPWLLFPGFAAIVTILTGRREAFGPWIVVHNWAVLFLFMSQAFIYVLYMAGLADAGSAVRLVRDIYMPLRLIVHWRVAVGSLGLPWPIATGAAVIPVLGLEILSVILFDAFVPDSFALQ